ncbi:hypothetical protein [Acinetobacter sp. 'aerobic (ED)']|uniref:hypothetical protein n=1 Tax=Acinetobacter sp. 'aerobic (ED)' TaxID=174230 RepID=UPI00192B6796|nr:hypothetical protein [Acinetobacter sp. 'aerobic (ED)']
MKLFPNILLGKVWHMTSINHLKNIYSKGFIYANPNDDLLFQDKWGNFAVKSGKTYVQSINGVSVFDLIDFNYSEYLERIDPPRNAVKNIVNSRMVEGGCIWLEVDVDGIDFIDRNSLYAKWSEDIKSEINLQFLPGLEAAVIGDIPVDRIKKIYLYMEKNNNYYCVGRELIQF